MNDICRVEMKLESTINTYVFISHSRKDEAVARELADTQVKGAAAALREGKSKGYVIIGYIRNDADFRKIEIYP